VNAARLRLAARTRLLASRWHPRRSLSAKLTLFYATLFGFAFALTLYGARSGIERYAERIVDTEMQAGSKVFDRITAMRYDQLGDAARVLSADFGFRTAVASADAPTIASALDSLQRRQGVSQAFFVATDGTVTGYRGALPEAEAKRVYDALDDGATRGVLRVGDAAFNAAAAPVQAPVLLGWVVFANALDATELASLARLSAVDLKPRIVAVRDLPAGIRVAPTGTIPATERDVNGERILLQASPVPTFGAGAPLALVLEYSLSRALAEYAPMLWLLLGSGIVGIAIAVAGSWLLAQRLTRPIKALDAAARKVSGGEHVQVPVDTEDELGTLAQSFNKMVVDIEQRERQIAHMAFHDSLTGLANRSLLREHLTMAIARLPAGKKLALLCLDLDNFKVINDTLGHPTGDGLLCEIATRLSAICGDGFVARLGGDEFALVLPDDGRSLDRMARDIITAVSAPCHVNGHRMVPGTSIGLAIAPQDGDDVTTLFKNADLALYRAKQEGKGGFRFFEAAMNAEAQARRQMELDLHDAIQNGELFLMFQPLFNLAEGQVSAFEALLRWQHPTRGLVSPLDFIPLAEDTGLIIPIGEWVLREACRVAATWAEPVRIAVNVSAVQFKTAGLNAVVLQALAESGLDPQRLELEITESLFIANVEATLSQLHSLRALGVRVALDDFGTGYSSLSYLRSFPFDKIKIDRSFIIDLLSSDGATAIIKSITTLAEALGMETTAEGVENAGQLDILREQGCSHIQGFYFSKPVLASEVHRMLGHDSDMARKVA
jgi:diguanylate cyclase (GGDEF)-like protein